MLKAGKDPIDNVIPFRLDGGSGDGLADVIELYPFADVVKMPFQSAPQQRALGWWGDLIPFTTDWSHDDRGGDSAA
jgi:hypothetical protein